MKDLRENLNVSNESLETPSREERKGWLIVRYDVSKDDLSAIDQETMDEWKSSNRTIVMLMLDEQETLSGEDREDYESLVERLNEAEIPNFNYDNELEEYLDAEHRPESGEV